MLDDYLGPWETYRLLIQNSEVHFGSQAKSDDRYTESLIRLTNYFGPDFVVPDQAEAFLWTYTWYLRGDLGIHLGLSHRYLDILSSRMLPLIENGADVHGYPQAITAATPLQRILLFNVSEMGLFGFWAAVRNLRPNNEMSRLCVTCAYQKAIAAPPVDEWLALLKRAGKDLCEYGETELQVWHILSLIKQTHVCQASWHLRSYEDKQTIGLVKDFRFPIVVNGGEGLVLRHIGTSERRVHFHIDPKSDWKFQLTWEDSWDKDQLGRSACFCFDELGRKRNPAEIKEATMAQWALKEEHEKKLKAETPERKMESMPGSWKEGLPDVIIRTNDADRYFEGQLDLLKSVYARAECGNITAAGRPL